MYSYILYIALRMSVCLSDRFVHDDDGPTKEALVIRSVLLF